MYYRSPLGFSRDIQRQFQRSDLTFASRRLNKSETRVRLFTCDGRNFSQHFTWRFCCVWLGLHGPVVDSVDGVRCVLWTSGGQA